MSPKRAPTAADERDMYPRKTPPKGHPAAELAIPHEVRDERGTGVVEGDELRQVRENRPTNVRIGHLETRVDGVVSDLGEIKGTVKGIHDMLAEDRKRRDDSRKFWRDVALKVVGGIFSSGVILAVLRAWGVL